MHVVCWDLDETLGSFRPLADELIDRMRLYRRGMLGTFHRLSRAFQGPRPPGAITLREGIVDLLRALDDDGVVQVLTTASYRTYAELSLERAGIASSFAHVFTRAELLVGDTKKYQPVLERVGCEAKDVLIIGDVYQRDRAADHPRIPMIVQPHGWKEPAAPLLPLLQALRRAPNFLEGWERLFAEATLEGRKRRITLAGVAATIDRWGPAQPEPTPVIVEITASASRGEV